MILIIALLHAIPVLIAGAIFRTKAAVWISSIIMLVIGISTGSSAHAAADILAIVIGGFFAIGFCHPSNEDKIQAAQRKLPYEKPININFKEKAFFACLKQQENLGLDPDSKSVMEDTLSRISQIEAEVVAYSMETKFIVFESVEELFEAIPLIHQLTLTGIPLKKAVRSFMDNIRRNNA